MLRVVIFFIHSFVRSFLPSLLSRSSFSRAPSFLLLTVSMLFGMFARTHTQARNVSTRDDLLDVPISRFLSVASHLRISRFGELDMSRTQPSWAKSQDILGRHPRRGKPYFMPEIFETYLCMCGCENFPEYSITFLADLSSSFPSTLPSFALFSFSFYFYPLTSLFSQLLTAAAFVRSRRFLSELIAEI